MVIGRDPSQTDVFLDDPELSRQHARLDLLEGVVSITDLKSRNGTRVNGRRVESKQLVPGDVVVAGKTKLTFVPGGG